MKRHLMNFSLSNQMSTSTQLGVDLHSNYESQFEPNMRALEEYQLDQQQLPQAYNSVWRSLLGLKAKWLLFQLCISLSLPPPAFLSINRPLFQWDSYNLREKYQRMYAYLLRFTDAGSAQQMLIRDSMLIEWPCLRHPVQDAGNSKSSGEFKAEMVDRAPLLFISRNSKSSRQSYPTAQLSILALNRQTAPVVVRCRARIVTENVNRMEMERYGKWQSVGKLMKEQSEKQHVDISYEEENEALVVSCGELSTSPLQFDNAGTLMVPFSEISIDTCGRRANSNLERHRLEIHCYMKFINGVEIENTVLSNPFLIAASNEQNTAMLGDMAWEILSSTAIHRPISSYPQRLCWGELKKFLRHSVQSQLSEARTLDNEELLHLQCMLFLPLAVGHKDLKQLEDYLFGPESERNVIDKVGMKKIKQRLLKEFVCDYVEIEAHHFLKKKCVSMKDGETRLKHSVWEWLSQATEMIADRDPAHRICQNQSLQTKKKKTKSSVMLNLFNDRIITMTSQSRVWRAYKALYHFEKKPGQSSIKAMLVSFCTDIAGHLTIYYSNVRSNKRPTFGNMSAAELKAHDGGLVGMLMQASYPSQFDHLIRFDSDIDALRKQQGITLPPKKRIFIGFRPKTPLQPHSVDPLQHDALLGPAGTGKQANFLPSFQLTLSRLPNTASKHPHQKSSDTAKRVIANTCINLSTETKNAAHIKHSIGIEHILRFHNDLNSNKPMLK